MRLSANAPCPCGSGRKHKGCCGPLLDGAPATSPEALMRSRYTAYVAGHVAHLQRTTLPGGPHWQADARAWGAELRAYCAAVNFEGLEVRETWTRGEDGGVTFYARLRHDGRDASFGEASTFRRVAGRWLYMDGVRIEDARGAAPRSGSR